MSITSGLHRSQQDLLNEEMEGGNVEVVEELRIPGLDNLHTKSLEEIGQVLANVIKSRQGITSIEYVLGKKIRVKYLPSRPLGNLSS